MEGWGKQAQDFEKAIVCAQCETQSQLWVLMKLTNIVKLCNQSHISNVCTFLIEVYNKCSH